VVVTVVMTVVVSVDTSVDTSDVLQERIIEYNENKSDASLKEEEAY